VVALDINKNKVKELLLVPYFCACIHAPPQPNYQIIYMLNNQVNDQKQNDYLKTAAHDFSAITINGQLETVSSNTTGLSSL
jgi:hypothetical protein